MGRYYYDFHIHSCLSPCADDDMTPNNIVNMAIINGLDVIAVTDHNSTGNSAAIIEAGKNVGLLVIPGIEVTTVEEIHIICLFPQLQLAEAFGNYVYNNMLEIENKAYIFGNQFYMDKDDNEVDTEQRLLITASNIGIYDIVELVSEYQGVAILAHIDRQANGVIGVLGDIDPLMGFRVAEVAETDHPLKYIEHYPHLLFLKGSDAHNLLSISDKKHYLELEGLSTENVINYLKYH